MSFKVYGITFGRKGGENKFNFTYEFKFLERFLVVSLAHYNSQEVILYKENTYI